MRVEWSAEELVGSWTLVDEDWRLVANRTGPTRLGFALLLKFFEVEARFPSSIDDLVREAKANKRAFQARVRTVLHSSYTHRYRRMLPPLLAALSFRCNNTAY